jgi:hypothetical protein
MSDYEKTVVEGESRMRILRLFILSLLVYKKHSTSSQTL